jgi:molybdopterin-guanine dinucleotide biosynthesis protein A
MAGTTAVVLAGGSSRRMGVDKRLLRLFPTSPTALERTVAIGRFVADRVAVVSDAGLMFEPGGVAVVADLWPSQGPLGALLTAFRAYPDDRVVVLAVDYQMLQVELVARVIAGLEGHDAAVAVEAEIDGGRRHPLVGAYDARRCAEAAEALFGAGERSMGALLSRLTVREVGVERPDRHGIHRLSLTNVNAPADVEWLRRESAEMDARRT